MYKPSQYRIIRRPEVLTRLGIGNTFLHKLIKSNLIPPPISIGSRSVGWIEHEIDVVIEALAASKSEEFMQSLVRHLVENRKLNFQLKGWQ